MKKIFSSLIIFVSLFSASFVLAASSFSFSPSSASLDKGKTFSSSVSVNPGSEKIYSVKLVVSYPADKVEITGFNFGSGWMSGFSPEDKIDNANGIMIKTAGWPKGFDASKVLGTISFKSKTSGTGEISVSSSSLLLTGKNANDLNTSALAKISFTFKEPVVAKTPAPSSTLEKPKEEVIPSSNNSGNISEETSATSTISATTTPETGILSLEEKEAAKNSLLAKVGGIFSFKNLVSFFALLIVIISLALFLKKNKK